MRIHFLFHFAAPAALVLCALTTAPARAVTQIDLPPDRVEFRDGPGAQAARENCTICHSAQYVYMQPPLTRAQWEAEVTKMRKAYGAPVPESATQTIADYLYSQNGKPSGEGPEKVQRPR